MPDRYQRQSLLKHASDPAAAWDVIVIGGGATGLATAWDAVSRGLKVALVERSDFVKATSSRSTKLVHGGVRYLQNGEIGLVKEALRERKRLLENAPEFARSLRFVLPTVRPLGRYYYRFGMLLYDILAGSAGLERAELLSEAETRDRLPGIALEKLTGGVAYSDAQFDDAALAIAMAQAVCAGGGVALNYVEAEKLLVENGKIAGLIAKDTESGDAWEMRSKIVINATGIFSDAFRVENDVKCQWKVRTSRGSHIVCDKGVMPGDHALIIPKTQDGRVLFAIPWKQHVVIGTTDIPTDGPCDDPSPTEEEVGFILEEAGRALGISAGDVKSQWSGLRPLVSRVKAKSTAALSRKHVLEVSPEGLVSVLGGKWTTCRKMGEDAIDCALEHHGVRSGKSETADRKLTEHGAIAPAMDLHDESADLQPEVRSNRVREACRSGFARTLEDMMTRRMRLLQLDARKALDLAPEIAALMAQELSWGQVEIDANVHDFEEVARSFLPVSDSAS